jgi:hypothetical protein
MIVKNHKIEPKLVDGTCLIILFIYPLGCTKSVIRSQEHESRIFQYGSHWVLSEGSELRTTNFTNYWVTPDSATGKYAQLVVDLGCMKTVNGFYLRNTHNGRITNRGTKEFTIFTSKNSHDSWEPILNGTFERIWHTGIERTVFFSETKYILCTLYVNQSY